MSIKKNENRNHKDSNICIIYQLVFVIMEESLHFFSFIDFYRPQTELQEGNVFTPVSHSVHRVCVSQHAMDREVCTPTRQTTPWADTPQAETPLPPSKTATEAGGTHPTGMHSCFE